MDSFEKFKNRINERTQSSVEAYKEFLEDEEIKKQIANAAGIISETIKKGGILLVCGNGGSAADATHIVGEFRGRFESKNRSSLPADSLTDLSSITAIANDYGYEKVYARQVESYKNQPFVLLGISTSGNSKNIIEAVKVAKEANQPTIALLGKDGGELGKLVDIPLIVKKEDTYLIQQGHMLIYHIICRLIDDEFKE